MEKKTIGQFIAVLRKSNGLTQKDLAAELNVSDKTISHWERDESAPDLTLIPVIADLFGVTTDELLRGERRPVVGRAAAATAAAAAAAGAEDAADDADGTDTEDVPPKPDRRADRRLRVLLDRIETKFRTCSLIAGGIGVLGLLTALIFNFAVWWAGLGFFLALALYAAGVVTEVVALINARASLNTDDFDGDRLAACKKAVRRIACTTFSVLAGLCAFTLPLLTDTEYQKVKIWANTWFPDGALYVLILAAVWAVVFLISRSGALKARIRDDRFFKLKGLCILFTVLALLLTFALQYVLNDVIDLDTLLADHLTFDSVEAFAEYAETDTHPYAEYKRVEQARILNPDGTLLCTVFIKNEDIWEWTYSWEESGEILFTVTTMEQAQEGRRKGSIANGAYAGLYVVEIAAGFVVYSKLKKKKAAR